MTGDVSLAIYSHLFSK